MQHWHIRKPRCATERGLLVGMTYKRGTTGVAERAYTYDTLGRPLTRCTARKGTTVNDTFAHNNRSELTEATVSGASYSYAYDKAPDGGKGDWTNLAAGLPRRGEGAMGRARINIGNRTSAQEAAEEATDYTADALNQYTSIQEGEQEAFAPQFDAAGNHTQVQTSTDIRLPLSCPHCLKIRANALLMAGLTRGRKRSKAGRVDF